MATYHGITKIACTDPDCGFSTTDDTSMEIVNDQGDGLCEVCGHNTLRYWMSDGKVTDVTWVEAGGGGTPVHTDVTPTLVVSGVGEGLAGYPQPADANDPHYDSVRDLVSAEPEYLPPSRDF